MEIHFPYGGFLRSLMNIITETDSLAQACQKLGAADYVTVDTEFQRTNTFWPILCLVQIAGPNDDYIIDPLSDGISMKPFYDLMANQSVLKVLHASRQDLEIFCHEANILPNPVFDTQLAAMVCGFGDSVGYETLVKSLVNQSIDKSSRFTDWTRRPLSKKTTELCDWRCHPFARCL